MKHCPNLKHQVAAHSLNLNSSTHLFRKNKVELLHITSLI